MSVPNASQPEKRFLLMITGDRTQHLSAPLGCTSVVKVKHELQKARTSFAPKRCPGAGMAFVAIVVEMRVLKHPRLSKVASAGAHSYFEDACVGEVPLLGDDEKELDYCVDANELIDDAELQLWRDEEERLRTPPNSGSDLCLYELHVIPDCL
jgi:hypothetical protein